MARPKVPQEILYVQKLHYLTFLSSFTMLSSLIVAILINKHAGLVLALTGFCLSYLVTLRKQQFAVPKAEEIVHRLAVKFASRQLSPRSAAIAATQLYYLLGDVQRAELLLEAYLLSGEPLIQTTLADIYLHQGKTKKAINCLDPLRRLEHPLVHWTLGRLFLQQRDYTTALVHLTRARQLAEQQGLPKTSGFLNQLFMNWSVKASLLHALAECHYELGEGKLARKFVRWGNRYLIDPGLWRRNYS